MTAYAPQVLREPMDPVDRAWLEMDTPHNPMVVSAILEFEDVGDPAALAQALVERTLREPRFRQRVVDDDGYHWVEDEAPHLGYHVHTRRLEGPSDAELRAAVAAEFSQALDRALPLWRIALFLRGKGRVTMLFRAHHAIADGVAMMKLMLRLADGAPERHAAAQAEAPPRHAGPLGGMIDRLETVNSAIENLTGLVVDDLRHPARLARHVADLRRTVAAIGRVVLLPDDNPRRFRAPPSGRRAVAWTSNLSLAAVRKLARQQGATLNDVFLTALTGAFGRYLRDRDGSVPETQNLRVAVPVNLRAGDDDSLGNGFGLVLADLPVGLEGWHARLDVISDRMASLKESAEARAVLIALSAAGHLPVAAEKQLVGLISNKAAAVVSNLPGPSEGLTVAGTRLANVVFWPPQAAAIGIGVSLLSYAGHVTVGVSSDGAQLADPQYVIDAFCAELEAMLGRSPAARPGAAHRRRRRTHPTARSLPGAFHANS